MANDWIDIRLPSGRQMGRFVLWGSGRLFFSGSLFLLDASTHVLESVVILFKWTKKATLNLIRVYDQLPYMGMPAANIIDATAVTVLEPSEIVTNLTQILEGKHCLIVGDTGTGKSTIAQWLAYQIGGTVTVYDPDAAPDEWQGLNVIGRCGNFGAITAAMQADLEDLQARVELRGENGDKALSGKESITIAEEFPLLADEVPVATEWLVKHARRGRKPKRFIIALSQDDSVKALRVEGEGVRKNFRMVRLGKFAVTHAKALKDTMVIEWLKAGKYRCMVDDLPCQLPDLSQFKAVTQQLRLPAVFTPPSDAETTAQQAFQPMKLSKTDLPEAVIRAIRASVAIGISDSRIIKEILNFQGTEYGKGRELLEKIKAGAK